MEIKALALQAKQLVATRSVTQAFVGQALRVVSENVDARGKHGNPSVRRRIPAAIRAVYPSHREHVVRSLGTSDRGATKELARAENTRIDIEFRQKRQELELSRASLAAKRISRLDDEQLQAVAKFRVRQVLENDSTSSPP